MGKGIGGEFKKLGGKSKVWEKEESQKQRTTVPVPAAGQPIGLALFDISPASK